MTEINYVCPHCGSEQIQRYSIAYSNGLSDVSTKTVGVGVSGGGLGVGGAKTTGTSQTALSQSVAPPSKYSYVKEALIAFLAIPLVFDIIRKLILPSFIPSISYLIFTIAYLYFHTYMVAFKYNHDIYPKDLEAWNNSWLCMKCGHRFIL